MDLLYLIFLAWILVMWAWIREAPAAVKLLYGASLLALVMSYLLFFAPGS